MFNHTHTDTVENREATRQNLRLVISSALKTLFGDPGFGTGLHRIIFEQNDVILQDIVIDEIYTAITTFMPQIYVTRNNITIDSYRDKLIMTVKYMNIIDKQVDTYSLNMTNDKITER